jgi:hypothetical protein
MALLAEAGSSSEKLVVGTPVSAMEASMGFGVWLDS